MRRIFLQRIKATAYRFRDPALLKRAARFPLCLTLRQKYLKFQGQSDPQYRHCGFKRKITQIRVQNLN